MFCSALCLSALHVRESLDVICSALSHKDKNRAKVSEFFCDLNLFAPLSIRHETEKWESMFEKAAKKSHKKNSRNLYRHNFLITIFQGRFVKNVEKI